MEKLSGLQPETEEAVNANLQKCLVETDLDFGERTVV